MSEFTEMEGLRDGENKTPDAQRMPEKIYIVAAHEGSYSDYTTWEVAAYTSQDDAHQHRDAANELAARKYSECVALPWDKRKHVDLTTPYDSQLLNDGWEQRVYTVNELTLFASMEQMLGEKA
jgi:hypothetical protein